MASGLPVITPASFVLARSGKLYYSNSGKRGGGGEAALAVELINIPSSPRFDLLCKFYFGADFKELGNGQFIGFEIEIDDQDIVAHSYQAAPDINIGAGANNASPAFLEFILPRRSKLVVTGLSSDTDNQRWAVLIGYPL